MYVSFKPTLKKEGVLSTYVIFFLQTVGVTTSSDVKDENRSLSEKEPSAFFLYVTIATSFVNLFR